MRKSLPVMKATPSKFSEASRVHYAALYARPGAMHAGFAQSVLSLFEDDPEVVRQLAQLIVEAHFVSVRQPPFKPFCHEE